MVPWSRQLRNCDSERTWYRGKRKDCLHRSYRHSIQTEADVRFFELVKSSFSKQGLKIPQIGDNLKNTFRVGPFSKRDTTVASAQAVTAYQEFCREISDTSSPYLNSSGELGTRPCFNIDDIPTADDITHYERHCMEMVNTGSATTDSNSETHVPDIADNSDVLELCTKLEYCHIMFAGNHSGLPSDHNGCLHPALYCPFGEFGDAWRANELPAGFDKHKQGSECNHKYATYALLMGHMRSASCSCHEAAFAFMEVMYCTDLNYGCHVKWVDERCYNLVSCYKNTRELKGDNKIAPGTSAKSSSTVTDEFEIAPGGGKREKSSMESYIIPKKIRLEDHADV